MRTSRLTPLAIIASIVALAGVSATSASAAAPRHTFDAGVATCFLPHNVYGGSGPTITAPSVRFTNANRRLLTVHAFAIIVNAQTEQRVHSALIGSATLRQHDRATFPKRTLDLPSRSTSAFWPAAIRVQLDVYSGGKLVEVWNGKPSLYKIYTNGAFDRTYAGTASWC